MKPNDFVQPPAQEKPEQTRQTSTRVGWNGGVGGWAERQCRGFSAFALCLPHHSSGNQKTLPDLPGFAETRGDAKPACATPTRQRRTGTKHRTANLKPNLIVPRGANEFFSCPAAKHQFCRQSLSDQGGLSPHRPNVHDQRPAPRHET